MSTPLTFLVTSTPFKRLNINNFFRISCWQIKAKRKNCYGQPHKKSFILKKIFRFWKVQFVLYLYDLNEKKGCLDQPSPLSSTKFSFRIALITFWIRLIFVDWIQFRGFESVSFVIKESFFFFLSFPIHCNWNHCLVPRSYLKVLRWDHFEKSYRNSFESQPSRRPMDRIQKVDKQKKRFIQRSQSLIDPCKFNSFMLTKQPTRNTCRICYPWVSLLVFVFFHNPTHLPSSHPYEPPSSTYPNTLLMVFDYVEVIVFQWVFPGSEISDKSIPRWLSYKNGVLKRLK